MPDLLKGQVCAITFEERHTREGAHTLIGTWTGEIDRWGKRTIVPLDSCADGPHYLFTDEVLDVVPLSEVEVQTETAGIRQHRLERALKRLREAQQLLDEAGGGADYRWASEVAGVAGRVQTAIAEAEGVLEGAKASS